MVISNPRKWQKEAAPVLLGKTKALLVAPPGQGKSFIGMAWAAWWAEQGKKILIVTPRNSIKGSFGKNLAFCVAGNDFKSCPSEGHVINYKANILSQKTLKLWFLLETKSTYIGTHQELISASNDLNFDDGQCSDLAIVVDEAHLLEVSNGMGKLISELSEKGVPLLLMTATPFRRDGGYIISPELMSQFDVYNRTMGQSLDEMKYLKGIGSQIVVGPISKVLKVVLKYILDNNRYAVLRFPEVNSNHAKRWAQELHLDNNQPYKKGFEKEVERICGELGMECCSIATDDVNDSSFFDPENGILAKIRDATTPEGLPRLIISQNKVEMGTDCPWWTDSIMIGVSGSCVRTTQFGQRCSRDHFSKDGKMACAWTLVPDYWEPGVSTEKITTLTMDLIKYQLWSLFIGGINPPDMSVATGDRLASTASQTYLSQSPDVFTQNFLNVISNIISGKVEPEDDVGAVVTLLDKAIKKAPICVYSHTLSNEKEISSVSSYGNEIHVLPGMAEITLPKDVIRSDASVEEIVSAIREYAHTLGTYILNGNGLKFETNLRTENIDVIIKGNFKRGWDSLRNANDVGWSVTEVEDLLKDFGLMHRPPKRQRHRGEKSLQ